MLHRLKQQKISILVSTPYMDEASLCDRIALMQNGTIMSVDTPANIIDSFPAQLFATKAKDIYHMLKVFRTDPAVASCYAFGENLHLTLKDDRNGNTTLRRLAELYKAEEFQAELIKPEIEDSFIRLMLNEEPLQLKNE